MPDWVAGSSAAASKKSAGQIHVGCNFLTPTATCLQTAFNGARLARAVRWPGSNASRLALCVTRGVMPPRPRAKAVSHASAPISTLSSAAFTALLLSDRPSSTRPHPSCSRPAYTFCRARSRGWSWRRSSTRASEPLALCVHASSIEMCSVCEARATAMRRGPLPMVPDCLLSNVCIFVPIMRM